MNQIDDMPVCEIRSPVWTIETPNLDDYQQHMALLGCINLVRAGVASFKVRLTNRKVTKGKKRMPGVDYVPEPGLTPDCHEGTLYDAPTNKEGKVYLRLRMDDARRRPDGEPSYTCISLQGIRSFRPLFPVPGRRDYVASVLNERADELEAQANELRARAVALRQ